MRKTTYLLTTLALVGLLCTTPLALAGKVDVDADAATDEATGAAGISADHAQPTAAPEGFWGWLTLRFSLMADRLGEVLGMAGQDAPDTSGEATVKAGLDGVDVGGSVAGVSLDGGQVSEVEDRANGALGKVHEAKGSLPALPVAPSLPHVG